MGKPTDEQILAAVTHWGNGTMTYVVRNVLASRYGGGFHDLKTSWVRRQLQRLERQGRVKRGPTSYAVQICWYATSTGDAS